MKKKRKKLEILEVQIEECKSSYRNFENEKLAYHFMPEQAGNFWIRFYFGFLTCFLSFIGFISKKQAVINKQINVQHKIVIDQKNSEILYDIKKFNKLLEDKITILNDKLDKVKFTEIKVIQTDSEGWIDLKNASIFSFPNVTNKKVIYIGRIKNWYIWYKNINER